MKNDNDGNSQYSIKVAAGYRHVTTIGCYLATYGSYQCETFVGIKVPMYWINAQEISKDVFDSVALQEVSAIMQSQKEPSHAVQK